MAFAEAYRNQVALLIRTLSFVTEEHCFALKGGTAINLFVRAMPRLSVDIDLTYLPVAPREESLAGIDGAMRRIAARIKAHIPGAQVTESLAERTVVKLLVCSGGVQTKIEVTPVLRGCVFDAGLQPVAPAVEEAFGFAEARVVSFADLYGGKIVAALDRQHPRDLFDVRDLLANEGITDAIRQAFIVYLISHGRPMAEVLASRRKDFSAEFMHGFSGMTEQPVSIDELVRAHETLLAEIVGRMPNAHRKFLLSFERVESEWALLGVASAPELPAVRWRQQNLDTLSDDRRRSLVDGLEALLSGGVDG